MRGLPIWMLQAQKATALPTTMMPGYAAETVTPIPMLANNTILANKSEGEETIVEDHNV